MELLIGVIVGGLLFGSSCKPTDNKKLVSRKGFKGHCIYCTSRSAPDCPYHKEKDMNV